MTEKNYQAFENWLNCKLDYADEAFLKKVNKTKEEYVDEIGLEYINQATENNRNNYIDTDDEETMADSVAELAIQDLSLSFYLGEEVYKIIAKDIEDAAKAIHEKYPIRKGETVIAMPHRDAKNAAHRITWKIAGHTTQPSFVRYKLTSVIYSQYKKLRTA